MTATRVIHGVKPGLLTNEILTSAEPLVLNGFCAQWPAVCASSSEQGILNYIQKHYAKLPITTCIIPASEKGRVFYNENMTGFNFSTNLESFSTFCRFLVNEISAAIPRGIYMPSTNVSRWFPSFEMENGACIDHLKPIKQLWIGNNTRVAAHYDVASNLACCLAGRRRFTLFPPGQIENLYPGPLKFSPGGQEISLVDFHNPDFKKFPKFKEALKCSQEVTLEPGDALFIPEMWWHHVEGLDAVNVLYTHWWTSSSEFLALPSDALLHAILSMRNLTQEQKNNWRCIFDYYVFESSVEDQQHIPSHALGILKLPLPIEDGNHLKSALSKKLGG